MQSFKPIKKRLGDLLVDTGLITSSQLSDALELQRKKSVRIGRALLELKYITEDLLLAFLGRQCGMSYVSLKEFGEIDPQAINAIPEYLAREWEVFPVSLSSDGTITVAVSDPFNLSAIDDLRLISGYEVKTVIASSDDIKNFIDRYYVFRNTLSDSSVLHSSSSSSTRQPSKSESETLVKSLLQHSLLMGATDIYLIHNNDDDDDDAEGEPVRASYFLSSRHIKTIALSRRESEAIFAFFKKSRGEIIFETSGASVEFVFLKQNKNLSRTVSSQSGRFSATLIPSTDSVLRSSSSCSRIKIRELPGSLAHKRINDLGLAPDDFLMVEKHILQSRRGLAVISSEPSGGKTYFMEALAGAFAAPQRISYFFSNSRKTPPAAISGKEDDDTSVGVFSSFRLTGAPSASPVISVPTKDITEIFPAPADAVFYEYSGLSEDNKILSDIYSLIDNSLAVVSIPTEKIPAVLISQNISPRLYIRLKLARRLCPECRVRYAVSRDYLVNSGIAPKGGFVPPMLPPSGGEDMILTKSAGCDFCAHTGYHGFALAYYMTDSISSSDGSGTPFLSAVREGIFRNLWSLALKGEISIEEVILHKNTYA